MLSCIGAVHYRAHKVKPSAIMVFSGRNAMRVVHLGFAVRGDSQQFEQPRHIGWIRLIPGCSKIAARRATAGLGGTEWKLAEQSPSDDGIAFEFPASKLN